MLLDSGESAEVQPWDDDQEVFTMNLLSCMSLRCPQWIVTDTENKRVKVDGRRTRNQES